MRAIAFLSVLVGCGVEGEAGETSAAGKGAKLDTAREESRDQECVPHGDVNLDGFVDGDDMFIVQTNEDAEGYLTWEEGDMDGDFDVDANDVAIVQTNLYELYDDECYPCLSPGDLDADNDVDEADAGYLEGLLGVATVAGALLGDFDGTGVVDETDQEIFEAVYLGAVYECDNCLALGDATGNGVVDSNDGEALFATGMGASASTKAGDLDLDGMIDWDDVTVLQTFFGVEYECKAGTTVAAAVR